MTDLEKLDFLIERIVEQSKIMTQQTKRMDTLESNLIDTKNDLKGEIRKTKYDLKQELHDAKSGFGNEKNGLRDSVRELKFLLEEEISKPLSMVAEGQPELSRKVD